MKNKKGELTSSQIVTLVILIVSFAVILLFFLVFNFKSETEKEACRNSVILRGATPLGKETVRLQCSTKEVCISKGKNCGYQTNEIEVLTVKNKDELLNHLADLMYDCWWQMGEGKVNYAPSSWEGQYCVMCNVITIDDSIKNDNSLNKVTMSELFGKLANKKVPGKSFNYLYYLYGFSSLTVALNAYTQVSGGRAAMNDVLSRGLDFTKFNKYALVTSVQSGASVPAVIGGAISAATLSGLKGGAVCSTFAPGAGTVVCAIGGGIIGGTAAFIISSYVKGTDFLPPTYLPYNDEAIKGLECKEFVSLAA